MKIASENLNRLRILPIAVVLFCTPAISLLLADRSAAAVDHAIYAELLSRHVRDGVVDYNGFKGEEKRLDAYLAVLERTDTSALSDKEQFAFYVNAYNAWTVKLILGGYPGVASIKDLGSLFKSPWKKRIARIDGSTITLDHIEHDILRARFRDPRVHFAVNCASKGCPPLLGEPYLGSELDRQLDGVARAFINDPGRNRLEGTTLFVSKIFKWFEGDFNDDIVRFFKKYAEGDLRAGMDAIEARGEKIRIRYLPYDWSLNGK